MQVFLAKSQDFANNHQQLIQSGILEIKLFYILHTSHNIFCFNIWGVCVWGGGCGVGVWGVGRCVWGCVGVFGCVCGVGRVCVCVRGHHAKGTVVRNLSGLTRNVI